MALKHEPTAPYHSVQDALRVLETVARARRRCHRRRDRPRRPASHDRLTALLRHAAPRGVRRAGRRRRLRHRCLPQPGSAPPHGHDQALREPSSSTPSTGCATRWARRSTSAGTSTARSRSPQCADGPAHARGQRVGRLPLRRARQRGRQVPAEPARPERPARPSLPPQDRPGSPRARSPTRSCCSPSWTPSRPRSRSWTSRSTRWARSARPSRITAGSAVGCLALSLPIEHAHRLRAAADTLNRGAAPVLLSLAI